jgi:hypothetical protein
VNFVHGERGKRSRESQPRTSNIRILILIKRVGDCDD